MKTEQERAVTNKLCYDTAIQYNSPRLPHHLRSYIVDHYFRMGSYVITFARFYEDFWYEVGQSLDADAFELIDKKIIEWVRIMEFEQGFTEAGLIFDCAIETKKYIQE